MPSLRWRVLTVLALIGAASGCLSESGSESERSPEPETRASAGAALVAVDADARVVARRDGRELLAGPPSVTQPQTDERPTYAMRVREGGREVAAPTRVLGAALVAGGVVWITPDHRLIDGQGRVLDRDVLPELAVSADGREVAYPHLAAARPGVYVVSTGGGAPRLVTAALASADRPLWLADGRLVVIGSRASGIAGVWLVDPAGRAQPLAVTNGELRTGRPLGPTFVPPPAFHASMHVEGDVLVYDDGRAERRVPLPVAP